MIARRPEWLVLIVSLILCALTYSGRLQSADEIAVYALSLNLATRGGLDVNVIASTEPGMSAPPFTNVGEFGPDGNFYSGKGILPSILALPFVRAALWIPAADPVAAALVLNALLTALTAFIVARCVRTLYADHRASLLAGVLYVGGTMALAYAKRLFTEPAAAFCVVLSYSLLAQSWHGGISKKRLLLAGCVIGGAVAASYSNAVFLPCFLLLVVYRARADRAPFSRLLTSAGVFMTGLLPWVFLLAWYNFARFGDITQNGLPLLAWSLPFLTPQAAAIRFGALLLSPYRGFIWYTPLLLLTPVAVLRLWRARADRARDREFDLSRGNLLFALGCTGCYLVFFSMWSMWWGGFNWGPRFLLPVTPLWVIALAPTLGSVGAKRQGGKGWALVTSTLKASVVVLSIAVAIVGGVSDTFQSEGRLARAGQLSALVSPRNLTDTPLLTGVGYFQGFSGFDLLTHGDLDVWWRQSPALNDVNMKGALRDVADRSTPDSVVVFISPMYVEPFLHAYKLPLPVVGLAPDQKGIDMLSHRIATDYARILLVTDQGLTDPHNTLERALESAAFRARNEFYDSWRAVVFGTAQGPFARLKMPVRFGNSLVMQELEYSPRVQRGQAVAIRVHWQKPISDTLGSVAWFAHLVSPEGALVGQHDALVGDAYGWGGTAELDDRRGILVPADALPGVYVVNVGVYEPGGLRLPASDNSGSLPDNVVTFSIQVDN